MNSIKSFKYVQLGSEAITYLRECLARGHTLAKFLLSRLDLEQGAVFAPVPRSSKRDTISNFRHGPLLPQPTVSNHLYKQGIRARIVPVPTTDYILAQLVRNYLRQSKHKVCVFEEAVALRSDPYVKTLRSRMLFYNEEVYYVLLPADNSEEVVSRTIQQATNPYPGLIGIMTMTDEDLSLRRGRITEAGLRTIADQAEKIIIGAYHGEGYLIWEKPEDRKKAGERNRNWERRRV